MLRSRWCARCACAAKTAAFAALLVLASWVPYARSADAPLVWPDTEPAGHARAYFEAFGAGEDAMRAFWTAHGSPAALAQRPVEARLSVWRDMNTAHGALTPLSVVESRADFIKVRARSAHAVLLEIGFRCEPESPHGLVALGVEELGPESQGPPLAEVPILPDTTLGAALLAEADTLAMAGTFSGAVLLDKDGKALAGRAYGLASRASGRANTLQTRFNLGSINKIFTQVAIEQLAQKGALSLDDPVRKYLSDYVVPGAENVTIRMLLEHRGGVPDVLENPELWKHPATIRTSKDWYWLARGMPLQFEPGTQQQYSNGGYVLLGEVISRVSGEDYYDYIRRHIYVPAGMYASDHYPRNEPSLERALGYTFHAGDADVAKPRGHGPWLCTDHGLGRGSAAGGGYSTVGDLVRFARALRAHKLLDDAHTRDIIGPDMQLGIAGGSPGVNALLLLSGPYALVVLANLDPPAAERFAQTSGRSVRRKGGGSTMPRTVGHGPSPQ